MFILARKTKIGVESGAGENLALFLSSFPLAGQAEQVLGHGEMRAVLFLLLVVGLGLLTAVLGLILMACFMLFEERLATRNQASRKPKELQAREAEESR